MNEKEFAELAAGAAMNALSPDDDVHLRAALVAHPEWHAIAEDDTETAVRLSAAVVPVNPPAAIRAALLAQIATTPQGDREATHVDQPASPEPMAHAAPKRRWTRAVFALAACLAVLVGVGVGAVALNGQLNRPASVVALEEIQSSVDADQATVQLDDGATATAHWSASTGKVVLVTDGVPATADGETYELWFVRGENAVPAGVFAVEDGRATAALDGDMQAGDVIAVTVEQAGGSPTGTPTTDPVIVIPTA